MYSTNTGIYPLRPLAFSFCTVLVFLFRQLYPYCIVHVLQTFADVAKYILLVTALYLSIRYAYVNALHRRSLELLPSLQSLASPVPVRVAQLVAQLELEQRLEAPVNALVQVRVPQRPPTFECT